MILSIEQLKASIKEKDDFYFTFFGMMLCYLFNKYLSVVFYTALIRWNKKVTPFREYGLDYHLMLELRNNTNHNTIYNNTVSVWLYKIILLNISLFNMILLSSSAPITYLYCRIAAMSWRGFQNFDVCQHLTWSIFNWRVTLLSSICV